MNKTNIQNKNKNKNQFIHASVSIVIALAPIASPLVAMDDALATKGKKVIKQSSP